MLFYMDIGHKDIWLPHAECSSDAYKLMNILHGESSSVKILCNPTDATASKKLYSSRKYESWLKNKH